MRYSKSIRRDSLKYSKPSKNVEAEIAEMVQQSTKDLCGSEDMKAVNRVREILQWLESLPISSLPYVEMGFDSLDPKIIASLNSHR